MALTATDTKKLYAEGNSLDIINAHETITINSGDLVRIGEVIGVSVNKLLPGSVSPMNRDRDGHCSHGEILLSGAFVIPKIAGTAIAQGASFRLRPISGTLAYAGTLATAATGDLSGDFYAYEAAASTATFMVVSINRSKTTVT